MTAAIVQAPPLDAYPPLTPEPAPWVLRVEPCACGGHVVQLAGDRPADVVALHQRDPQHMAWRSAQ